MFLPGELVSAALPREERSNPFQEQKMDIGGLGELEHGAGL